MKLTLDKDFGAAEVDRDWDEGKTLIQEAKDLGWSVYHESFDERDTWCVCSDAPGKSFPLQGSQMTTLILVYDQKRWSIGEAPED